MADKTLYAVRKDFVQRVSGVVICQLLDDLLEEKVLNNEEAEEVRVGQTTSIAKARCLIDMVRLKGVKASEKLISTLKQRDTMLLDDLFSGLTAAPVLANQPTPLPLQEPPVSPVLIHSTEEFKRRILQAHKNLIYPTMPKSERKRLALLINNVEFDLKRLLRKGAEKDEEKIEELLRGLDYEVVKGRNLSAQDMEQAVKEFSQRSEHAQSDSAFVVVMSHGMRDAICGVHYDGEQSKDVFKIDRIFTHLNTRNCAGLRDKPKVILIQACRGDERGSTWVADSVPVETPCLEDDSIKEKHKEKDFISLMSCTPDTKSYRDVDEGTFFIRRVVETFNTNAHEDHIEELFRKVMGRFEDFSRQMPSKDRATLIKHFYLFPGL